MKKTICSLVLCLSIVLTSIFASCGTGDYSDGHLPTELTESLMGENPRFSDFIPYSEKDIKLFWGNDIPIDAESVIYSPNGEDISEIGILHAAKGSDPQEVLTAARQYIDDLRSRKGDFVRSYIPDEEKKLNDARAEILGRYIVFTVLEKEEADAVFESLKNTLKK